MFTIKECLWTLIGRLDRVSSFTAVHTFLTRQFLKQEWFRGLFYTTSNIISGAVLHDVQHNFWGRVTRHPIQLWHVPHVVADSWFFETSAAHSVPFRTSEHVASAGAALSGGRQPTDRRQVFNGTAWSMRSGGTATREREVGHLW